MHDLTMQVVADGQRRQQLSWILEFLDIGRLVDSNGDVVFQLADQSAGDRGQHCDKPVILLDGSSAATTQSVAGNPEVGSPEGNVVARLSWPPRYDTLSAAVYAAQSYLRQETASSAEDYGQFRELVGRSEGICNARALMAKVAQSDATVLITGESGTGKEIVARAIHAHSNRAAGPFVPLNCGAIPSELLESELFGHEKGAFTGAVSDKVGRFELAGGGTLFLDEIGDMPVPMQVKVLRALQDRCFERVGGTETKYADVRIVAATHRDLEQMIEVGSFREDLFYRLNVFPIELPPLRARTEDIPALVGVMCQQIDSVQGLQVRLTVDALQLLACYPWPGNVRELRNLLERLAIQFPNELVSSSDLPARYRDSGVASTQTASPSVSLRVVEESEDRPSLLPVNGINLREHLAQLERSLIEQALEDTNSVVARAADRLHVRRTTLVEKMRKYGIERV